MIQNLVKSATKAIVKNGTTIAVGAVYTALVGSATYYLGSSAKRDKERTDMALKRQEIGLPKYHTQQEFDHELQQIGKGIQ